MSSFYLLLFICTLTLILLAILISHVIAKSVVRNGSVNCHQIAIYVIYFHEIAM